MGPNGRRSIRIPRQIDNEAIRRDAIHRVSPKRPKPVPYIAAGKRVEFNHNQVESRPN